MFKEMRAGPDASLGEGLCPVVPPTAPTSKGEKWGGAGSQVSRCQSGTGVIGTFTGPHSWGWLWLHLEGVDGPESIRILGIQRGTSQKREDTLLLGGGWVG